MTLGSFQIFSNILGDIHKSRCTTGINVAVNYKGEPKNRCVDTGGNFATGVNDTGGKFALSVNDTGGK
jgi:hypothetical protein